MTEEEILKIVMKYVDLETFEKIRKEIFKANKPNLNYEK